MCVLALVASACNTGKTVDQASDSIRATDQNRPVDEMVADSPFTDEMDLYEQLVVARELWAGHAPVSYDLVVERLCDEPCTSSARRNTVIDGRLMASVSTDGTGGGNPATMRELFADVESRARNDQPTTVQWDAATGAVQRIDVVFDDNAPVPRFATVASLEEPTLIPPNQHGLEFVERSCPQTDWSVVSGSEFTLALPPQLSRRDAEGADSEIAEFVSSDLEVSWDFGEYSNPLDYWQGPFTSEIVNFSNVGGKIVVAEPVEGGWPPVHQTAVHFGRVSAWDEDYWLGLTLSVLYPDPAMAPIADCIVRSIDWLR